MTHDTPRTATTVDVDVPGRPSTPHERLYTRSLVTNCLLIGFISIGGAIAGSSMASEIVGGIWGEVRRLEIVPFALVAVAALLAGATTTRGGTRPRRRTAYLAVGAVVVVALAFAAGTATRLNDQGVWRTGFPSDRSFVDLAMTNPERHISTYWAAILSTSELLDHAEIIIPPGTPYDALWRAFASDIVTFDPTHDPALPAGAPATGPPWYEHPLGEPGTLAIVGHGDVYRYYTTPEGIVLIGGS